MMGYPAGAPRKMWFADIDEDAPPGSPWRPYLQLDGCVAVVENWFDTKEDCEWFIRENLLGTGWMDGPRRYPCPDCLAPADEWCVSFVTGAKLLTFHSERMRYQFRGWPS